ncbi:MAG: NADPH-dependent F420 reductase [Dehalococcoidia bacterium]|nr:NADPH-dependent F420 reductase [Dehalococcoidia bacterium]
MPQRIALVGGTGPEGRGLAARFALAGHEVTLGSRDATRAADAAGELTEQLAAAGSTARVHGAANAEAVADCDVAVIVVPYEAHRTTLESLATPLTGKVVVDAVVPVRFERGPRPVEVPEGSATEQAAAILPDSHVIGAFHNLAADALLDLERPLDADVLVTGGDAEAKALVSALAEQIEGVRAVDAGPLRFSRFVEGLTVLLIGINGRYKAHSAPRIVGLPERTAS